MAYQMKRSGIVSERLELLDEKGEKVHTLEVRLDVDTMARSINEKYMQLVKANQKLTGLKEHPDERKDEPADDALREVGDAIYALYETVFGKENAKTIIDFYENRMIEMNMEVTPFILQVVVPRVREAVKEIKAKTAAGYIRKKR